MTEFEHVTSQSAVEIYEATSGVFGGLIREIRGLSSKKPDAILSKSKVTILNKVLEELLKILGSEPEGKFLSLLDNETLPQTSDAVLVMVQFEIALNAFESRYKTRIRWDYGNYSDEWVTHELIKEIESDTEE